MSDTTSANKRQRSVSLGAWLIPGKAPRHGSPGDAVVGSRGKPQAGAVRHGCAESPIEIVNGTSFPPLHDKPDGKTEKDDGWSKYTKGGSGRSVSRATGNTPDVARYEDPEVQEQLRSILDGLGEEQQHVINRVLEGKSIFFTGAAGTGKSFLLKKLHQALIAIGKGCSTFLTGTTGKAAVGIGGCTVHSFAGIGLGNEPIEDLLSRVQRSKYTQRRWAACEVLIIDEISMMDGALFDKLNLVGQRMKGRPLPFGGVQLVLCGDFLQLPPVGINRSGVKFCFEAAAWNSSLDGSIVLQKVFRQKDASFLNILHELRKGVVSQGTYDVLQCKVRESKERTRASIVSRRPDDESPETDAQPREGKPRGEGSTYTRLFSRNDDVDRLNQREMMALVGDSHVYEARDTGDPTFLRQLQNNCPAAATLELRVGCKVLLLKNLDPANQLVNGATGEVIEFAEASGRKLPKVKFDSLDGKGSPPQVIREEEWTVSVGDREVARRSQVPLRLAWALSIHKAQGMTIPKVAISFQGMFEFGQAYVALSRATSLDGLNLLDFSREVVKAHSRVKAFYANLEESAGNVAGDRTAPTGVAIVPRIGPAPPQPGGWMRRSPPERGPYRAVTRPPLPDGGHRSSTVFPATATGERKTGVSQALSPEAIKRMEESRRRAQEKLREKRARSVASNTR